MKKLLIIPSVFALGSFFLASCGNSTPDASMKSPVQNNVVNINLKATQEMSENEVNHDANRKTIENMQAAFKGETIASAKYAAYSTKAEQEGFHQIALLFKAASVSENIHANNHKAVLDESGIGVPAITPEFIVKTTKENLLDAIAGETYEATTMYPEFLTEANAAGNQLAMMSLNYAYKTEKKHRVFYEAALTALQNNTTTSLSTVFFVCPTCGNTYETKTPGRCGISMTAGEKFIKITSL